MKYLVFFVCLFTTASLYAQDFTLLESDAEGDPTVGGIVDLRAISFAIDEQNDSLWFKIELHTALPGDLGIVFGVDTDLIPDNGLNWDSPGNMDLQPEVVFTINRNFIDPGSLYGFSNNNLNHTSRFGDNDSSIIVNMQLSLLDDDGRFNFILGSSTFDCDVNNRSIFDDLPESGFLSIDLTSTAGELNAPRPKIYPNPVADYLFFQDFEFSSIEAISIINCAGQTVLETAGTIVDHPGIDLSGLSKGVYFLLIRSAGSKDCMKFIKY